MATLKAMYSNDWCYAKPEYTGSGSCGLGGDALVRNMQDNKNFSGIYAQDCCK